MVKLMDHGELLSVRTENLDSNQLDMIIYLENRMQYNDERGALAQILHQLIAQGMVPAKDIASRLGAYEGAGINLDEGSPPYLIAEDEDEAEVLDETSEIPVDETEALEPAKVDEDREN